MEIENEINELKQKLDRLDSIEVTMNSKGYSWNVKIYGKAEDVLNRVVEIEGKLKEKYGTVKA